MLNTPNNAPEQREEVLPAIEQDLGDLKKEVTDSQQDSPEKVEERKRFEEVGQVLKTWINLWINYWWWVFGTPINTPEIELNGWSWDSGGSSKLVLKDNNGKPYFIFERSRSLTEEHISELHEQNATIYVDGEYMNYNANWEWTRWNYNNYHLLPKIKKYLEKTKKIVEAKRWEIKE